jgi:hypothetical protein
LGYTLCGALGARKDKKEMADYFVPANIYQGRGSAESPGTGTAVGDIPQANPLSFAGVDYIPNDTEPDPAVGPPAGGINHMSIGVMATDATGDTDKEQPAAMLEAFKRMGAGGGATRIAVPGGADVVLTQCAYAGPPAAGVFLIAPSDIGMGPGQVPPSPVAWTEPVLRPHPSVFVRDASHCRGVVSQLGGDTDAAQMNSAFPGVQVFEVLDAPTYSVWTLLIDGAAQAVIFPHLDANGAKIDVRRPRDIWNRIVVPELQRRIAQGEPLPLYKTAGFGTLVVRGYISRLNYVSYGRLCAFDPATPTRPLFVPA